MACFSGAATVIDQADISAIDADPRQDYHFPMPNIKDLTVAQLQRAIEIKEQIEKLQAQLNSIAGGGGKTPSPAQIKAPSPTKRKYRMTAAHRRKLIKTLARARAIRWAKIKGKDAVKAMKKKDRRMSAAVKAKLSAMAKARWARAKAEGKKRL